jgi:hypothetical protein
MMMDPYNGVIVYLEDNKRHLRVLENVSTIQWLVEEYQLHWNFNWLLDCIYRGDDIPSHQNLGLCLAACEGRLDSVRFLVQNGALPDAYECVALRVAAANGHLPVVQYLIQEHNIWHVDALPLAHRNGHVHVVKHLSGGVLSPFKTFKTALRGTFRKLSLSIKSHG